jgi:hypothetical protein
MNTQPSRAIENQSINSSRTWGSLLLGVLGGGLLVGSTLGADTDVAGVRAGLAEGGEGLELLLLGGDSAGLLSDVAGGESGEVAGDVGRKVLTLGVTGLGLTLDAGEDDEAGLVGLEALDVDGLALLGLGAAAVVNNNAKTLGLLAGNASELELRKGEAAAL